MAEETKLISVITISYNNYTGLSKTIESVLALKDNDIEYIVIDGGSNDGTIELLNSYRDKIDVIISEKDYGISDAFNKGVKFSKGKWLFFLNSGDTFSSNIILLNLKSDLIRNQDKYLCFYKVELSNGESTMPNNRLIEKKGIEYIINRAEIPHQGAFISNKLFVKYGMFNTALKVRMDYDFFLRVRSESNKFVFIDDIVAIYEIGGISNQVEYIDRFLIEGVVSKMQNKVKLSVIDFYYILYFFILRKNKYGIC
jgi:glycosyltransferase involved in cell wall biosynthesis